MRKWIAVLAVAASLQAPLAAQAAEHFDLIYPKLSASDDPRDQFPLAVLALAFKEEGATFTARKSDALMENSRAREAVANAEGGVNITWTGLSKDYEAMLRPVRVPIYRGLLGHRIFIINKSRQADFDKVKTLADLKAFTAGQGIGWTDVTILGDAGLKVVTNKYDLLFKQVAANRIDYFPRGVAEAPAEVAAHAKDLPDLAVEKHVMVVYPFDLFFYTSKANEKLAALIEAGLTKAYEDGSYIKLFNDSPFIQAALKAADLKDRVRIDIPNPLESDADKAIPASYWMKE